MPNQREFRLAASKYLSVLTKYVPIVDRVHGDHHPEFHEVRRLWEEISRKMKEAEEESLPDLEQEFLSLRKITEGYKIPEGVCESYEAVYNMLAELDRAYHN